MTKPPTVAAPAAGLGSNSNYILSSDCKPILDLSVTINVTEDIVCQSSAPGPDGLEPIPGFGFQLNAYSPAGESTAWQQYAFSHFPGQLSAVINNWPLTGRSIIEEYVQLTSTPDPRTTLAAGNQLEVSLRNDGWRNQWDLAVTGDWGGPGSSGLLLYDRAAGHAAFYAVDAAGAIAPLAEYTDWRTSWDVAVTGAWGGPGNSGLLLYDRAAGHAVFYAVSPRGELTLLQDYQGWRTSWDLILTGGWGSGAGGTGLLLYDRAAGSGVFYGVDPRGEMILLWEHDDWYTGWDLGVTGSWGRTGETGLLLYGRAVGVGTLYSVSDQGELHLVIDSNQWGTSWDVAVTGGWGGPGNTGLLLYDRAAGHAAFYAISSRGEKTLLLDYPGWRTSWDLVIGGGWGGPVAGGLLLYDRAAWFGGFYVVDSQAALTLLAKSDSSVTGVTYTVTGRGGTVLAQKAIDLASISDVSADDLAPIIAVELNLVGLLDSESSVLSSGAGTIVYRASSPLTVSAQEPPCAQVGFVTAETANSVYGLLPAGPGDTFTQSFGVTYEAMIRKEGKPRPSLSPPPGRTAP